MIKAIIPIILVAFDFGEAAVCACCRDWPRVLYWISAGLITVASMLMR